jgi:hypothetical protein
MITPQNKMITHNEDTQTRIRTMKRLTSREVLLTLCLLAGAAHAASDGDGFAPLGPEWPCRWCTMLNPALQDPCSMCRSPKPWVCTGCTFENAQRQKQDACEMCLQDKTPPVSEHGDDQPINEPIGAPVVLVSGPVAPGPPPLGLRGAHSNPPQVVVSPPRNDEAKEAEPAPRVVPENKLDKLPARLEVLGFYPDRPNERHANNPAPRRDIQGFHFVDSRVQFPDEAKVNGPDLIELHRYNIFQVCHLSMRGGPTAHHTGPVDQMLCPQGPIDANWHPTRYPGPGEHPRSTHEIAEGLKDAYTARCQNGEKDGELYNRALDFNAKYLGGDLNSNAPTANGSTPIKFLTFNMLDQGLAGEGGGFRTNWDTENNDSDEADHHYQDIIDTPESGHAVKEDPTQLSPRYQRALSIILEQDPDIVTVQECDRTTLFRQVMEAAGYGCHFNEKTASAATRAGKTYRKTHRLGEGVHMDNVGIFWNKRTFEDIYGPRKIFLPNSKGGALSGMGKQAAMWMLLRNKTTRRLTAVVTAHQKSGKEKGEDKLVKQTQAARMAEILRDELGPNVPIIFGCDFNNGTETESYADFRRQVPFMAEAYEDTYGLSPTWGSSKWRSGGGQTEKIGFTPNNIDFVFYTRRFFKPLQVLAYPNWEKEPLEACNLPGYKYPSDHFAHMAVFEERDVSPAHALVEEMYHLVKRNHVTPAHDQEVRDDAGKLVRMDYRFYFPKVDAAPEGVDRAVILRTFQKYRSYFTEATAWDTMGVSPGQALNADGVLYAQVAGADAVDFAIYKDKATDQARRMNKHNQLRCDMEKQGAVYRTYAILKHSILCGGGRAIEDGGATLASCTPKTLMVEVKNKFNGSKNPMYKKFNKLEITKAELIANLAAAKELWVRKFVRKTMMKGAFTNRPEWEGRNYDMRTLSQDLAQIPTGVLLGAFADAQRLNTEALIENIIPRLEQANEESMARAQMAAQQAPEVNDEKSQPQNEPVVPQDPAQPQADGRRSPRQNQGRRLMEQERRC